MVLGLSVQAGSRWSGVLDTDMMVLSSQSASTELVGLVLSRRQLSQPSRLKSRLFVFLSLTRESIFCFYAEPSLLFTEGMSNPHT